MTEKSLNGSRPQESLPGLEFLGHATELLGQLPNGQAVNLALEFKELLSEGIKVRLIRNEDGSVMFTEEGIRSEVILPEAFVHRVRRLLIETGAPELELDADRKLQAGHQDLPKAAAH